MTISGLRHGLFASPVSRAITFAAALLLAFACLADFAHAVGAADGCPEGKVESHRPPLPSVDSAVVSDRIECPHVSTTGRVSDTGAVVTTPFVLARPASPRAPPIA